MQFYSRRVSQDRCHTDLKISRGASKVEIVATESDLLIWARTMLSAQDTLRIISPSMAL